MEKYPEILSLKPNELIDWCNRRKKEMGLSNNKLAKLSNVPEGTIDRIFTGKNPEFRYSTIQPIVALLIGINDEVPTDKDEEYYTETIDGYRLIVENKNHVIENLKEAYTLLQQENNFLKEDIQDKRKIVNDYSEHCKWLERKIDSMEINK